MLAPNFEATAAVQLADPVQNARIGAAQRGFEERLRGHGGIAGAGGPGEPAYLREDTGVGLRKALAPQGGHPRHRIDVDLLEFILILRPM